MHRYLPTYLPTYLQGMVEMEHPNKLIDSFTGTLELTNGAFWHVKEVGRYVCMYVGRQGETFRGKQEEKRLF